MTGTLPDTGRPGVYQFVNLDDDIVYVGESGRIRGRLREHVKGFTSTIAGQRRLDYWEIKEINWWYVPNTEDYAGEENDPREEGELQLKYSSENNPYLNMSEGKEIEGPIDPASPDGKVELLTETEVKRRKNPYNRARRKLTFLSELVDHLEWSDGDEKVDAALQYHIGVLQSSLDELTTVNHDTHRFYRYNE